VTKGTEGKKGPSQSTLLVQIARQGVQLFHDDQGQGYVLILLKGKDVADRSEFYKIRSTSFRRWLRRQYLLNKGTVPGAQAVNDAIETIEGFAEFSGELIEPRLRIGSFHGTIWIDLGRDEWEPVIVNDAEWAVISGAIADAVHFVRPKGMLPLPVPEPGGSIEELRTFLNLSSEKDFILIVAWLLGALRPTGPYAVLVLLGEQGSAKSTTARLLKSLIDPTSAVFRSYPREERDLVISASNSWVLNFDNLGGLPSWMSDALCRISTGGGFCTRQLFTDREEIIFNDTRPIILNGITDIVHRHDLIDRCIFVTLPPIPDQRRKLEKELNESFIKAQPRILGALLDSVSMAIRNRSNVKLDSRPRMADFAEWIVAAEPALPWKPGAFLDAYNENRASIHHSALEADLFANALLEWFKGQDEWQGKASDLLVKIEEEAGDSDQKKIESLRRKKGWPTDPTRVSVKLRRLSSFLRRVGVEVTFNERSGRGRTISIKRIFESSVTSVTSVISQEEQDVRNDAKHGTDDAGGFLASQETSNDFNEHDADDADDAEKGLFLLDGESSGEAGQVPFPVEPGRGAVAAGCGPSVFCRECKLFMADEVNPKQGCGICRGEKSWNGQRVQYPFKEHGCEHFQI
jgi:hypothetical protein